VDKEVLKLYAITDRTWLEEGEKLREAVEKAILGGVTIVQYREKELKGEELKNEAVQVMEVCRKYNIPFIINDDVMLAHDIDADGVHVGQTDMAVGEARRILGRDKIVGATAKTVDQAIQAYQAGADYLGSGAVFGSTTKTDAKPLSMDYLKEIVESVPIPVVAIGGIDASNVSELIGLPIAGVSVIRGIFGEGNIRRSAAEVKSNLYGKPVVQCITNNVTVNDVANIVLALGGSPIMAHHIAEVEEIQAKASALLLNLGATDDYEAMKLAMQTAAKGSHPIVIDPVGVAVSSYRRQFFEELMKISSPACIRGNYAEILALSQNKTTLNGLDDSGMSEDMRVKMKVVGEVAGKYNTMVIATGETDIISDGESTLYVNTGHKMQKMITGSGCMLSAALATIYAVCGYTNINLTAGICSYIGDIARKAAFETEEHKQGTYTFKYRFLDSFTQ